MHGKNGLIGPAEECMDCVFYSLSHLFELEFEDRVQRIDKFFLTDSHANFNYRLYDFHPSM